MDCSCRPRCRHGAGASRGLPHVASPLQAGPLSNPTLQVRTLKLRNNREAKSSRSKSLSGGAATLIRVSVCPRSGIRPLYD